MEEQPITAQPQTHDDIAMTSFAFFTDRRKNKRYRLQNAVFLLTRPSVVKTATIRNISMGGLTYRCARSENPPRGDFSIDLLTADLNHCFRLENLPVTSVGEPVPVCVRINAAAGPRSLLLLDCRLRFRHLLAYQRERLKFLIRNYALDPA